MKIKKNGKIINLTEGDLKRIVKRVIRESEEQVEGNVNEIDYDGMKKIIPDLDKLLKITDTSGKTIGQTSNGYLYKFIPHNDEGVGTLTFYSLKETSGLPITVKVGTIIKRKLGTNNAKYNDYTSTLNWSASFDDLKKSEGGNMGAFVKIYDDMDDDIYNIIYKNITGNSSKFKESFNKQFKEYLDKNPVNLTSLEKLLKPGSKSREIYDTIKYVPNTEG